MRAEVLALALVAGSVPEEIVREAIAEAALAQVERPDPAWPESQRDCAGLVRWAYRDAFRQLAPERVTSGLWEDSEGRPAAFADGATLLRRSFAPLGRDADARQRLRSGDLLAFSRVDEDGAPVTHLMLVVRPADPAHGRALIVYHPGEKGAAVRLGALDDLVAEAPFAWKPVASNPLFRGFFRFKEWMP